MTNTLSNGVSRILSVRGWCMLIGTLQSVGPQFINLPPIDSFKAQLSRNVKTVKAKMTSHYQVQITPSKSNQIHPTSILHNVRLLYSLTTLFVIYYYKTIFMTVENNDLHWLYCKQQEKSIDKGSACMYYHETQMCRLYWHGQTNRGCRTLMEPNENIYKVCSGMFLQTWISNTSSAVTLTLYLFHTQKNDIATFFLWTIKIFFIKALRCRIFWNANHSILLKYLQFQCWAICIP